MKNWKATLISPNTPILQALKIIDTSALQIALVVDKNRRLLGTVTDGDVRRGILRNISMDEPVQRIMFTTPTTASIHSSPKEVLALMKRRELRHIPIVDSNGRVLDLKVLVHMVEPRGRDNWVVIMAGGLGMRLRPLTDDYPKPLLKVGGKPVLETILDNFLEYGFHRFYISVNYKAEMIEDYFGDGSRFGAGITYLREKESLGTAGALSLLPERPDTTFFVMNGDLLTKVNFLHLLDFHVERNVQATMCIREYQFQVPYGVVSADHHRLYGIDEKPVHSFFVNAGIYALEPLVLDVIPQDTCFDMPQVFKRLIDKNYQTAAFPIREYWLDIGHMQEFERANGEYCNMIE